MTYAQNLELNVDNIVNTLAPGSPMKIDKGTIRLDAALGYVITRDPILYHVNGTDVNLKFNCLRIVFHAPAEHSLYGVFPDVEMQVECQLETELDIIKEYKNRALIISYFFNGNARLDLEDNKVALLQGFNMDSFANVNVDIFRKMMKTDKFVMYEGSRSQPPCTENYLHIVDHRVYKVPKRVVDNIKDTLVNQLRLNFGNSRPIQALNGRPIIRTFEKAEKPKLTSKPNDFAVSAAPA
jgi:carbonic anhydrase